MENFNLKKLKRIFCFRNVAIVLCIFIIVTSLYIAFKPNLVEVFSNINIGDGSNHNTNNDKDLGNNTDNTNTNKDNINNNKVIDIKSSGQISEDDARKVAKKQFESLGETKIKTDELKVQQIKRSGEEYYYISSKENTLEIRIQDGKITRLNSVSVE